MRPLLSSFLLFLLFLASYGSAANIRRAPQSPAAPARELYNIFPTGANHGETASFISKTVGTDDLHPRTDVKGTLMLWTVEASHDQLAQLSSYPGIKEVTKLELPPAAKPATTAATAATIATAPPDHTSPALYRRDDDDSDDEDVVLKPFIIYPTDPTKKAETDATLAFLKTLTTVEMEPWFQNGGRDFWVWTSYLTDAQRDQAFNHSGIRAVGPNTDYMVQSTPRVLNRQRDDVVRSYVVIPADAANKAQTDEVTGYLRSLANADLWVELDEEGMVWLWTTKMTDAQREDAIKHAGIDSINFNSKLVPFSTPSGSGEPQPSKVKRDVSYTTQTAAVTELVSISQPQ